MTTETIETTALTNRDASPSVAATAGEGAVAPGLAYQDGAITPSTTMAAGSKYIFARLSSSSKVKSVKFESAAQGAGKFNIGVYYANSANEAPAALAGTIVAGAAGSGSDALFATDVDCASAVVITDVTNESGTYTIDKRLQPLWKACGMTADPKCAFDIVATVHTTAITTGTGLMGMSVAYVPGG